MQYELLSLIIQLVTAIIALFGVIYAGFQLRQGKRLQELTYKVHVADHDWNRRLAAQNALKDFNKSVLLSNLQKEFNYLNRKEPIPLSEVEERFRSNPLLQNELLQMLNAYEGLSRGVIQQIYDEEVVKSGRQGSMAKAFRAFYSYIEKRRDEMKAPSAYKDLQTLLAKWTHEENQITPRGPTNVMP